MQHRSPAKQVKKGVALRWYKIAKKGKSRTQAFLELFANKGLLTKIMSQSAEVLESRDLWDVKRGTYTAE